MADILSQPVIDRRGQDRHLLTKSLTAQIWSYQLASQPREAGLYLDHYDAKINVLDLGRVCPATHLDVIHIVEFVKQNREQNFGECQAKLLSDTMLSSSWLKVVSLDAAAHAIRFGASLWLFTETADWKNSESLCDFMERKAGTLCTRSAQVPTDSVLRFNARMLNRIAGMELIWTSNTMDHLRLDLEDPEAPQLFLFRHASFLSSHNQIGNADKQATNSIHIDILTKDEGVFPDGFLFETAQTIALLFPFAETNQKRWHKRVRRKADLDVEAAISCNTPRNLDHYHFWRDRLALIQQTFDQSKPDTMKQWLYDKRDSNRYYTFWLAVLAICLTLVFGLVQSVTGVIQVLKS